MLLPHSESKNPSLLNSRTEVHSRNLPFFTEPAVRLPSFPGLGRNTRDCLRSFAESPRMSASFESFGALPAHFILRTDRLKLALGRSVPGVNLGYFRPNKFAQFLVLYLSHLKFHSNLSYEDTD